MKVGNMRALNMVCKRCRKDVGDDEGLQCDFCKGYMHASCGDIMKGLKRELLRAGREQKGVHWYCIECSQDVKGIFRCMQDLKARMVALEVEVSRFTRMEVKSAESARNDEEMGAGSQRRLEVEKGQKKEEVGTREGTETEQRNVNECNTGWKQVGKELSVAARKNETTGVEIRNRFDVLQDTEGEHAGNTEGRFDVSQDTEDENVGKEVINRETVMIGSSMVGGVGKVLQREIGDKKFAWRKFPGAKIENITSKMKEVSLGDKVKNLVLMVGTNNLVDDGTTTIMKKYGELIEAAKDSGARRIVVVGIVARSDVGEYFESKRWAINCRLKKKCMEMGVNYVEMGGLYRDRDLWLWKDGLHLNWDGADRMGREIYKHLFLQRDVGGVTN